jgi:RNA polymerase sigma-70 factor, ECF subfamily
MNVQLFSHYPGARQTLAERQLRLAEGSGIRYSGPMRADVEQALNLIRNDDPGSLNRALGLLQETVFSFSMKVCGHPQDAEDTSQEVLLKTVSYLPKFENAQALAVWLYKVARNQCLMSRRGRKASRTANLSLDELMPDGRELLELLRSDRPGPEAQLLTKESSERLHGAILKVPPPYRFVLVLQDMEGLSTSEVAKVMGLREATVRVRLHRARLFLHKELMRKVDVHGRGNVRKAARSKPVQCRTLFARLSDYMDGLVETGYCEEMAKHIDDCVPCKAFLDSLASMVTLCSRHRVADCALGNSAVFREQLMREYQMAKTALDTKARAHAVQR